MRQYVLRNLEVWHKIPVEDFKNIFQEDIFSVFGEEIDSLLKLNKIKIQDNYIIPLTKGIFEFSVYVKFFYNQKYLKKLDKYYSTLFQS